MADFFDCLTKTKDLKLNLMRIKYFMIIFYFHFKSESTNRHIFEYLVHMNLE
jgi:hypothetical protein